jgi:hypothetical protein
MCPWSLSFANPAYSYSQCPHFSSLWSSWFRALKWTISQICPVLMLAAVLIFASQLQTQLGHTFSNPTFPFVSHMSCRWCGKLPATSVTDPDLPTIWKVGQYQTFDWIQSLVPHLTANLPKGTRAVLSRFPFLCFPKLQLRVVWIPATSVVHTTLTYSLRMRLLFSDKLQYESWLYYFWTLLLRQMALAILSLSFLIYKIVTIISTSWS